MIALDMRFLVSCAILTLVYIIHKQNTCVQLTLNNMDLHWVGPLMCRFLMVGWWALLSPTPPPATVQGSPVLLPHQFHYYFSMSFVFPLSGGTTDSWLSNFSFISILFWSQSSNDILKSISWCTNVCQTCSTVYFPHI